MDDYVQSRSLHIVNVFFIGAYLQRKIDAHLAIESEMDIEYSFSYLWYLLCLAHDIGYRYENSIKVYRELPEEYFMKDRCCSISSKKVSKNKVIFDSRYLWYRKNEVDIRSAYNIFNTYRGRIRGISNNCYKFQYNVRCKNHSKVIKPRYNNGLMNNYFYYRLCEINRH